MRGFGRTQIIQPLNRRRKGPPKRIPTLWACLLATACLMWFLGSEEDPVLHNSLVIDSTLSVSNTAKFTKKHEAAVIHSDGNDTTSSNVCDGYKGVLLIAQGDSYAAAGTLFFQYVINQLIFAQKFNLLPWVYLNNFSSSVYDGQVHGNKSGIDFQMIRGKVIGWGRYFDKQRKVVYRYPAAVNGDNLTSAIYHLEGDGIWHHYFFPVSNFTPGDCPNAALLQMRPWQVGTALHNFAPYAVRAWRYDMMPEKIRKNHLTVKEWLHPQRERAHRIFRTYYRFRPHIVDLADQALPQDRTSCLGLHVRHSDKAHGRQPVPLKDFLPYVESFVVAGGTCIFLATDSHLVVRELERNWPERVTRFVFQQNGTLRSHDLNAVFTLHSHHVTNTQVLVDILALSRCRFLLHGWSAVSEAAIYINLELHDNGVDLDDRANRTSLEEFESLVRSVL